MPSLPCHALPEGVLSLCFGSKRSCITCFLCQAFSAQWTTTWVSTREKAMRQHGLRSRTLLLLLCPCSLQQVQHTVLSAVGTAHYGMCKALARTVCCPQAA